MKWILDYCFIPLPDHLKSKLTYSRVSEKFHYL